MVMVTITIHDVVKGPIQIPPLGVNIKPNGTEKGANSTVSCSSGSYQVSETLGEVMSLIIAAGI
jgi:hypothetical protein